MVYGRNRRSLRGIATHGAALAVAGRIAHGEVREKNRADSEFGFNGMKTRLLLIFLLATTLILAAWLLYDRLHIPTITGLVIAVADGDTITLQTADNPKLKIRLAEIDTPEISQPYGLEAKQLLTQLALNQTAIVKTHGLDKYGRTLGRVYVNGLDINAALVEQGAAWVYVQYASDARLFALEQQARAAQRGLWVLPEAQRIAPWEWRHNKNLRSDPVRIEAIAGCGNKRTCKEMSDCNEAKFYLTQCGLSRLDKDKDGIPCEKLCLRK